ncbi:hypothetical protein ABL78_3383 [Leptomonas seymouri]|uniref:Uncharacterized protein n=1 Tax=Leptomonas seymouri TaxID=5684 RepID=A0A0N1IL17_LEPSE|nr:hypothetical protein ABL78_3383 [Leptomonas seymouri]|eukprot:KPI87540.1 hypothetical protein ABL78_3383 [Leptomonas seymouri]
MIPLMPVAAVRRALVGAVPLVLLVVLCLIASPAKLCQAHPTRFSSTSAARDRRVAELRNALRVEHHLEAVPDPPLELGIHAACKKFGRGCPDTYAAFLEDLVASLQHAVKMGREDASTEAAQSIDEPAAAIAREELLPPGSSVASCSPPSSSPSRLPLPLQSSWSYAEFKRLESILIRIRVAEGQLDRSGVSSRELQRKHRVPRGEDLSVVDDFNGEVTAQLSSMCLSIHQGRPASTASAKMTNNDAALYEAWCRWMEHRQETKEEGMQVEAPLKSAFQLASPPSTPLRCYVMDARRCYARLLMWLEPHLTFLVSWTCGVALPGAILTFVVLWVCAGEDWGDAAEGFLSGDADAEQAVTEEGREALDTPDSQELAAEKQFRRSRLAGLRFTFLECTQHRSWPMSFLKLRLVLCLAVAVDLLWSFGRILYVVLRPASSSSAASGHVALPTPLSYVLRLLPTWIQVSMNVYVITVLQGAVLHIALKGAANAYADWQDFIARCAAEQEYLLRAAADVAP